MLIVWVTYLLATGVVSGLFIAAGLRGRRAVALEKGRIDLPDDPLWADAEFDIHASGSRTNVGGALRLALKRVAPAVASQSVRVDIAVPPELFARTRPVLLAGFLEEMLTAAVHAAPGGRLLVTATIQGDRVHIAICDDVPGADPAIRAATIRGLMERVALRGHSLDIDVRPAEGTTMTLRLAIAADERTAEATQPLPERLAARRVRDGAPEFR